MAKQVKRETDAELVRRALRGDRDAYGALVERYQGAAVAFAFAVVRDFHLAEDVAQEAFVRAYEALHTLRKPAHFGGWLRSIVRRTATDFLRRHHWTASVEELRESGFDPADSSSDPASAVALSELHRIVLAVLAEMREDYREIIVLRHIEQRSYKEIADLLGMSVGAVGEKLSRVREILRRKLRRHLQNHPEA